MHAQHGKAVANVLIILALLVAGLGFGYWDYTRKQHNFNQAQQAEVKQMAQERQSRDCDAVAARLDDKYKDSGISISSRCDGIEPNSLLFRGSNCVAKAAPIVADEGLARRGFVRMGCCENGIKCRHNDWVWSNIY